MPTLKEKLTRVLSSGLGREPDLEELPNRHICGHVISQQFEDLDYEERDRLISALLDKAVRDGVLVSSELLQISTLLTYTPAEWSVVLTDIED